MNIVAFDLSLTSTGVCHPDGSTSTIISKKRGVERLDELEKAVRYLVIDANASRVVLEGYSFASRGRASVSLGELGGVIRLSLWRIDASYTEIPPSCRAKYATGSGSAKKTLAVQQAALRAERAFPNDDEADAWLMWQMALAHYAPDDPRLVRVPGKNRLGLDGVDWAQ